ncbi:hypothetical protein SAMN06272781_3660 [Streptomyces sp. 1222.2]|uniref:hypothetical protein n=1 Tax=Streptomyces sp. 1222.2 TaxID=1938833 RepID=UPI000BC92BD9|nr:hypothetical protein [Streptomyces sp. 1222.2]SOD75842.1 hypothetical protein SAMN06272781_3660 [Streptomyces sp. 1222.2]
MRTRKVTVIAAAVGVAVAAATGVTYASSALESAPKTTSLVQDAAPVAPRGGNGTGTEAGSNASSDPGGKENWGGKRGEGRGEGRSEGRGDNREEGRIYINERSYSADPGSCIAVVNVNSLIVPPLNSTSFNIRNESDRTVEFYNGVTCDNGAPVATVGPRSSSHSVAGQQQLQNLAIVGSFRVINNGHH